MSDWFSRNRHRYPANWETIALGVKEDAGWKCEACHEPHGPPPHILTVDHVVDHDPANVSRENLAALCQRCHLRRQGIDPRPTTKEQALAILRRRAAYERAQGVLL